MGLSSAVVGPVTVTFATGHTRTFPSVVAAQAATEGLTLVPRRGAWFEVAGSAKPLGNASLPTTKKPAKPAK